MVKKLICPDCKEPGLEQNYLGWHDCPNCGWKEMHPTHIDSIDDDDDDDMNESVRRTKMNENVHNLVTNIIAGNNAAASNIFDSIMMSKTSDMLDQAKAYVGSQMFGDGQVNEEYESIELDEETYKQLNETLASDATAEDWIHDFVHSDNPRFEGKSTAERIKMALGAFNSKN